jgi:hypothetical protein
MKYGKGAEAAEVNGTVVIRLALLDPSGFQVMK